MTEFKVNGGQHTNGRTPEERRETTLRDFFTKGLRTAGRDISWPDAQAGRQTIAKNSEFEHALIKWIQEAGFRLENLTLDNAGEKHRALFGAFLRVLNLHDLDSCPVIFSDKMTQFAITVSDGNILYLCGKITNVKKISGIEVRTIANVSSNFNPKTFPFVDTVAGDSSFGLIVDSDSYVADASEMYKRYLVLGQILETPEALLEGAIAIGPGTGEILADFLKSDPMVVQLSYTAVRDLVKGCSEEKAILRIATALMNGDINHILFILQHSSDERFDEVSLLKCAHLMKMAHGSALLGLAEVYTTVFVQIHEDESPIDRAGAEILGSLLAEGIINPNLDLQTTNTAEITRSLHKILDEELRAHGLEPGKYNAHSETTKLQVYID